MKNNENANVKEFKETVVNENNEAVEVVEIQKKGLFERFMALKTWQKVMVITLLTGAVAGGTFLIIKLIKNRPEAVAEAIDTVVSETAPEVAANVVNF